MLEDAPKNAMYYRLQATKIISGTNVLTKEKIREKIASPFNKKFNEI